jgi:hypothetical protein
VVVVVPLAETNQLLVLEDLVAEAQVQETLAETQ